jgi:uncharacterized protein (TIRG00374 family)
MTVTSRRRVSPLALTAMVALLLALEVAWLAPNLASSGEALAQIRWPWLLVAVAAEIASMATLARLQRTMLTAGGVRVPLHRAIAVTLAGTAMSITLPGGSVASAAYTFNRMRRWGASPALTAFALAVTAGLSSLALVVVVLETVALDGDDSGGLAVVPISTALLAAATVLWIIRRKPDLLLRPATAGLRLVNRVRRFPRNQGLPGLQSALGEFVRIKPGVAAWLRGFLFASVNWAADIACLMFACQAVGAHELTATTAVASYAAGVVGASLPLLPGGLGVVDAALIAGLSQGGLTVGAATAGVVVYRLISLVLVATVGWIAWWLQSRPAPRL